MYFKTESSQKHCDKGKGKETLTFISCQLFSQYFIFNSHNFENECCGVPIFRVTQQFREVLINV